MKLRELIKGIIVLDEVSVFAGVTRSHKDNVTELYLGIYHTGFSRALYSVDLTRETAQKIIDELTAALAVVAYTPDEIANHNDHMAYRKEREALDGH